MRWGANFLCLACDPIEVGLLDLTLWSPKTQKVGSIYLISHGKDRLKEAMIPPERFGFDGVPYFGLFLFKLLRPPWPIAAGSVCVLGWGGL